MSGGQGRQGRWRDTAHWIGLTSDLLLLYRARMVLRVTAGRMASPDSL